MAIPKIKTVEKISKALGDANRLKILQHISKSGGRGEYAELLEIIDLAQPSISHHIKILLEADIIRLKKSGRNHLYSLNASVIKEYMSFLATIKDKE